MYDIIRARRSIRVYQDRPVARETLEKLLEGAIWAPSAHNRQPWRFAIVTEVEAQHRLAAAMGQRLHDDLTADRRPLEEIEADVRRSFSRITGAPVLIVVCLSMVDMDRYPDDKRNAAEYIMAIQSTALAAQNLLLAAHSEGLGACWMCGPLFCPDVVVKTLDLPPDWQPQALITLGYPASARESARKPLETRVLWR